MAGSVASLTVLIAGRDTRWLVAAALGTFTAIVDFFVHPGTFGASGHEAIVTGIGAAVLSYGFSTLLHLIRHRRGGRG